MTSIRPAKLELAAAQFDWNIDQVVSELGRIRRASLQDRNRLNHPPALPSRSALSGIVDRLVTALFPNRLSARQMALENVDFFVGQTLDLSCRDLVDQVCIEDDVIIYAGATLLGPITVGRGSIIGANVSVTSNVPPGSRVTQAKSVLDSFVAGDGI